MTDLDNLLDGALEEFQDSPTTNRSPSSKGDANNTGESTQQTSLQRPNPGFSFNFNRPRSKPPAVSVAVESAGPRLPPKPVHKTKAKTKAAAAFESHNGSGSEPGPLTTNSTFDMSATVRALAQHNSPISAAAPVRHPGGTRQRSDSKHQGSNNQDPSPGTPQGDPEALMRQLNAQLQGKGGDSGVPGEMDAFVDGLLQQLLSKQILYQSMQDIGTRYPDWLEKHSASLKPEDLARYTEQHQHIKDICHQYETCPDDFGAIYDTLQKMQSCGTPPEEIVNELSPGLTFDSDGLPQMPGGGCPMQ